MRASESRDSRAINLGVYCDPLYVGRKSKGGLLEVEEVEELLLGVRR